jgi:hypothetical protein
MAGPARMSSFRGYISGGGGDGGIPTGDMYKYIPYKATKTVVRSTTTREKAKTPNVDMYRLVILGGTFEKIGGNDESIGGGNQKVG